MSEDSNPRPAEAELVRSLADEARALIAKIAGPVSHVSVQAGDCKIEVQLATAAPPTMVPMTDHAPAYAAAPAMAHAAPAAGGAATPAADERPADHYPVVAPLVGTFYRSPDPASKPFVEEGDVVEAGQVVGIVEAMKLMNRIEVDRPGRVAKILVANGEMVEYGQELLVLEPVEAA